MTKIAICGACGKMGRFIYDVISERDDCTVSAGIDKFGEAYADFPVVKEPADLPEKPDVIATTGYTEEDTAKIHKASEQIPVFFTFNMTLGINLLANLAKTAAKVLGGQYDIEIIEKHHNQKIDAPSGTAIMLADAINEELDNKYHYVYDRHSVRAKREKTEIGMHSVRGGTIVGEHEIIFAGRDEVISLKHEAHSKQVFAVGAVNAGVFLCGKPAGLYAMSDLLASL